MNAMILNEKEAAKLLGLSPSTLRKRRCMRLQPAYIRIGRSIRYRMADLNSYMDENRIDPRKNKGGKHA